jgi:hypothetical protein
MLLKLMFKKCGVRIHVIEDFEFLKRRKITSTAE